MHSAHALSYTQCSLVPRLSLSLPLDFARANIMHEKLKERESLVWNRAHLWSFSIEFLPNHGREGHGWAQFCTRLPLLQFFTDNVHAGEV